MNLDKLKAQMNKRLEGAKNLGNKKKNASKSRQTE